MSIIVQNNDVTDHSVFKEKVTITECLVDKCEGCTGSYINRMSGHRIICKCECHNKKQNVRAMKEEG
jgi:hypothetical protein